MTMTAKLADTDGLQSTADTQAASTILLVAWSLTRHPLHYPALGTLSSLFPQPGASLPCGVDPSGSLWRSETVAWLMLVEGVTELIHPHAPHPPSQLPLKCVLEVLKA